MAEVFSTRKLISQTVPSQGPPASPPLEKKKELPLDLSRVLAPELRPLNGPRGRPDRKKKDKKPIDISKRPIPWDGSIPDAVGNPFHRFWLSPNPNRPVLKDPSVENPRDIEQSPPDYAYRFPRPIDNNVNSFSNVYNPEALYSTWCGTVVVSYSAHQADLLVLVSTTTNDAIPTTGDETLAGRFLVCFRTMYLNIPFFRKQYDHHGRLSDCQQLGNSETDVVAVFLWKLPRADMTALWVILTIIHSRWPTEWINMDIPIDTLFEIARLVDMFGITPDTGGAWAQIRQRLEYTLGRQRMEVGRPQDRNVGKWLYIAHVFKWEEEFAVIWANLVVGTWKFEKDSRAVERYSQGFGGDPMPEVQQKWWFGVGDLGEDMKHHLMNDRFIVLYDLRHLWATFRQHDRMPTQRRATFEDIMVAAGKYKASCQDLREEIIAYAKEIMAQQQRVVFLTNRPLDPAIHAAVLADCQKLIRDVDAIFNRINSRDAHDNRVVVNYEEYWLPLEYIDPQIETPIELDPELGSKKTIFIFQSGWQDTMVYWRNQDPSNNPIATPNKRLAQLLFSFMVLLRFEYAVWYYLVQVDTAWEVRLTFWTILLFWWFAGDLAGRKIANVGRQIKTGIQKRKRDADAYKMLKVAKWLERVQVTDAAGVDLKPLPPSFYRDMETLQHERKQRELTPSKYLPEDLYQATRMEIEIRNFKRERQRRLDREDRERRRVEGVERQGVEEAERRRQEKGKMKASSYGQNDQYVWQSPVPLIGQSSGTYAPVGGQYHRMLRTASAAQKRYG
ncbi:hypothetical protein H072_4251 [Dactylellina haptotyla CBS 200.50]|uniref:Uncharacterized protein n=1 Tax=Dactylellina haptotyla (strain CBS 200.50) TaxID=1284197 RepID=S8AG06_DACHA|nr:hypothetical protein H072_4251 [Dactylellina haptotyla CBS 200.50]